MSGDFRKRVDLLAGEVRLKPTRKFLSALHNLATNSHAGHSTRQRHAEHSVLTSG